MDVMHHPKSDWPYDVMMDLLICLRKDGLPQTAEALEDVALQFLQERQMNSRGQAMKAIQISNPAGPS